MSEGRGRDPEEIAADLRRLCRDGNDVACLFALWIDMAAFAESDSRKATRRIVEQMLRDYRSWLAASSDVARRLDEIFIAETGMTLEDFLWLRDNGESPDEGERSWK